MTTYQVGDKVIVRDDLDCTSYAMYDTDNPRTMVVVDEMLSFRGREVTITKIADSYDGDFYYIAEDEGDFFWSDDMFSGRADDSQLEDDPAAWDSFFKNFSHIRE